MPVDPNPLAHLWNWVEIHTGARNEGGAYYGWWSGASGNLLPSFGDIAILSAAYAWYRHRKCVTCWRPGRHTTDETAQRFCHHHWTHAEVARHRELHRIKFPDHIAHNPKEHDV